MQLGGKLPDCGVPMLAEVVDLEGAVSCRSASSNLPASAILANRINKDKYLRLGKDMFGHKACFCAP